MYDNTYSCVSLFRFVKEILYRHTYTLYSLAHSVHIMVTFKPWWKNQTNKFILTVHQRVISNLIYSLGKIKVKCVFIYIQQVVNLLRLILQDLITRLQNCFKNTQRCFIMYRLTILITFPVFQIIKWVNYDMYYRILTGKLTV